MDTKSTPQNIQDAFLNTVRREKDTVTIYLMNGAKLSGRIRSFDKFSVLLESASQEQLIFKHAISTIQHARRTTSGEHRPPHAPDHGHEPGGEPTGRTDG
ncbi:MAG: host factor-I protein [Acidobacteriota bacterium]|nr:host factor-I protein [Acidobacteriota bacterium]